MVGRFILSHVVVDHVWRLLGLFFYYLDIVVCIKPRRVEVYCNPKVYPFLLPQISTWPNCTLHCMADSQVRYLFILIFIFLSSSLCLANCPLVW